MNTAMPIRATGLAIGLSLILASHASAQDSNKNQTELEAANQAAEADRLLKLGDFQAALPLYEAERASRAALGDARYEAYALRAIGICKAELGDEPGAIEVWIRARALDLKRDDPGYAGYDDFLISQGQIRLGKPLDAIASLERALPRLSQAVDRDHEADAQLSLTRLLVNLGRGQQARPHALRATELAESLGDAWRLADAWVATALVARAMGEPSLAYEHLTDASRLLDDQGRAHDVAFVATSLAATLVELGRSDLALEAFEQASQLHDHLDDAAGLAEDLAAIAGLHVENNRLDAALEVARKAVDKAVESGDPAREVEARVRLAQVFGRQNRWAAAADELDEAIPLGRVVARDDPAERIRLLLLAADVDRRAGRLESGRSRLETAKTVAEESGQDVLRKVVADTRQGFENAVRNETPKSR
jgi:tetratricopeptide (TPR) repeat protein